MFSKVIGFIKGLFVKTEMSDEQIERIVTSSMVRKEIVLPPKKVSLDDRLKMVELPLYAKNKTLPPKAKQKFIREAQQSKRD